MITEISIHLVKIAAVLGVMLTIVAYTVLMERWVCAWIQDRIGPNRVGPWGLLQPLADFGKLVLKEDVLPWHVQKFYYTLAPALTMVPALLTIAVVPWGSQLPIAGRMIDCIIANVDVGILFIFAIASLGVYGIVLAGWSSNSKYRGMFGAQRRAGFHAGRLAQFDEGCGVPRAAYLADSLSAPVVLHIHCQRIRRDEPVAVRFSGGGTGARRGLQHRVQLHEVWHVFHG
jgi:formate hydrogenlyase subunit 4